MPSLEDASPAPAAPTRELAQRLSGTVEVVLLWQPGTERVELALHDLATDVTFHLEVAPEDAIDAFHHPWAYAARPTRTDQRGRTAVPIPE